MCDDFHCNSKLLKEGKSPEKHNPLKRNNRYKGKGVEVGYKAFFDILSEAHGLVRPLSSTSSCPILPL